MKQIKIEKTTIPENKVVFKGSDNKELDYKDLIEHALDIVPQGGFTPKDIRDRNRIQVALDNATNVIALEDSDYDALEKIMRDSRWTIRDKELDQLLKNFEEGIYKKKEDKEEVKPPKK